MVLVFDDICSAVSDQETVDLARGATKSEACCDAHSINRRGDGQF
jgi:hypothetical protein